VSAPAPPARAWAALALASVGAFLAAWVVLPAPTRFLLPLGVAAPEVSAWLLVACLVALLLALGARPGSRGGWAAIALAAAGALCAVLPLAQIAGAARAADAATRAAFGPAYGAGAGYGRNAAFQPLDALGALRVPAVAVTRVVVDTVDGEVLHADVYRGAGAGPHPALVVVYGGAWRGGDPSDLPRLNHYLAARGYTVFAVDYRHAPRFPYPAAVDDVRAALGWVRAHAAEHDVDAERIALLGRSSGAHLALLAAYDSAPAVRVRAVIDYYGPVDLARGYAEPPRPDPLDVRDVLRSFIGGTPAELPQRYRDASPITLVRRAGAARRPLPPTLIVHGTRDHLGRVEFSRDLQRALVEAGARSALIEIPWAEHAFDAVFFGPGNQLALYHTERFLDLTLRR
jgi:acetyl esterase/lipase